MQKPFAGERILVVEDDYFIVADIVQDLQACGAEVIGPVPSVRLAMQKVLTTPNIHAALLDIHLQGVKVFPLADMLQERRIPVVFASAYDRHLIPQRHAGSKLLAKPFQIREFLGALDTKGHTRSHRVSASSNLILSSLDETCAEALGSLLRPIRLRKGDFIARAYEEFPLAVFVEHGVISLITETRQGQAIETGLIGNEGLVGAELALDDTRSTSRAVVQIAGEGLAVEAASFRKVCAMYPRLRSLIGRYLRTLQIQVNFAALANGKFKFEHRLARWLLMVDDRVEGSSLMLTHDLLALMLGVHRPGVTLALQTLEGQGYIRYLRGEVQIKDRDALIEFASGAYGIPEREYRRLMTSDVSPTRLRAPGVQMNGRHSS